MAKEGGKRKREQGKESEIERIREEERDVESERETQRGCE